MTNANSPSPDLLAVQRDAFKNGVLRARGYYASELEEFAELWALQAYPDPPKLREVILPGDSTTRTRCRDGVIEHSLCDGGWYANDMQIAERARVVVSLLDTPFESVSEGTHE